MNWAREHVLTESYVHERITKVRRRIDEHASTNSSVQDELEQLTNKLRNESDRFDELALEAPADARSVFFAKVSERHVQLRDVENRLCTARKTPAMNDGEVRRIEREALDRLGMLTQTLTSDPIEARAFLKELFLNGLTAKCPTGIAVEAFFWKVQLVPTTTASNSAGCAQTERGIRSF